MFLPVLCLSSFHDQDSHEIPSSLIMTLSYPWRCIGEEPASRGHRGREQRNLSSPLRRRRGRKRRSGKRWGTVTVSTGGGNIKGQCKERTREQCMTGKVPEKEGRDRTISAAKQTKMTAMRPITASSRPRNRRPGLSKNERTIKMSGVQRRGSGERRRY